MTIDPFTFVLSSRLRLGDCYELVFKAAIVINILLHENLF